MARSAVIALLIALLSIAPASAGNWINPGNVVNPTANQVVLTSGALSTQKVEGFVLLYGNTNVQFALERLTSGGATVATDSITLPAFPAAGAQIVLPLTIPFDAGDTFRVRVVGSVTGTVGAIIRLNEGYCLSGLGCAR